MEGFVLRYNTKTKGQIVKLNTKLFGKITTIKRNGEHLKYYYPGLLENKKFLKLANGCYFILSKTPEDSLYELKKAKIDIDENETKTARERWEEVIKKQRIKIRNL